MRRIAFMVCLGLSLAGCRPAQSGPATLTLYTQPETHAVGSVMANAYMQATDGQIELRVGGETLTEGEAALRFSPTTRTVSGVSTLIGLEALVIITHPANPVTELGLTSDEVDDLVTGEITTWDALGGRPVDVVSVQLAVESATRDVLLGFINGQVASTTRLVGSPDQMMAQVATLEGAFGVLPAHLVSNQAVQIMPVEDMLPDDRTIRTRGYPLVGSVVYVTAGEPQDDTRIFLEWVLSAEGQAALNDIITVP